MADIDMERRERSGMGWFWGLLALLAIVAVGWWVLDSLGDEGLEENVAADTETVFEDEEYETAAYPDEGAEMEETATGVGFAEVFNDPRGFIGEEIDGTVRVAELTQDGSGFWIEGEAGTGNRMFVPMTDEGSWPDITPGVTLEVSNAQVRDANEITDVAGQLDDATRQTLNEQGVFLDVDPSEVQVVQETGS